MGQLGGRRFHPLRRTPLHGWHEKAGAVFTHVGAWLRPDYYAVGKRSREDAILAEALAVRHDAGLIDIGTLGKFEVSGADAAAFLERIYTGRFARLAVGRLSYASDCGEAGGLSEDGPDAHLAEYQCYDYSPPATSA